MKVMQMRKSLTLVAIHLAVLRAMKSGRLGTLNSLRRVEKVILGC